MPINRYEHSELTVNVRAESAATETALQRVTFCAEQARAAVGDLYAALDACKALTIGISVETVKPKLRRPWWAFWRLP